MTFFFFFFNDTATTEIYTLSLHDALPISVIIEGGLGRVDAIGNLGDSLPHKLVSLIPDLCDACLNRAAAIRSEEHTSELQSQSNLVCRLLLEKKQITQTQRLSIQNCSLRV